MSHWVFGRIPAQARQIVVGSSQMSAVSDLMQHNATKRAMRLASREQKKNLVLGLKNSAFQTRTAGRTAAQNGLINH